MRAYRSTPGAGIDGLERVELPSPTPGPGQVHIRVRATSLNYRDLLLTRRNRMPLIPLSDGAGEVIAVGEGVRDFAAGDRVAGCFFPGWPDGDVAPRYLRLALGGDPADGTLAEEVVLPAEGVVHMPAHMTYDEAATLPCAWLTAWNAMFVEARLYPGQSVLLLGTGGVSIAGLQLARLAGLRAIITSSSNEKLARARELGADVTINYRENPDWERLVLDATNRRGVDQTLEVGGSATFAQSMSATRIGGHIALIGALAHEGADPGTAPLLNRNLRASRIYVGSRRMFEDMNRALELREVRPVIDRTFAFDDAVEAFRLMESQAHFSKIVIQLRD